jgi:hypothetical protein
MGNAWVKLVTKTFNDNKFKNGYTFKNAIKDAKKIYKKTKTAKHFVNKVVEKVENRGTRKHRGSRKHRG